MTRRLSAPAVLVAILVVASAHTAAAEMPVRDSVAAAGTAGNFGSTGNLLLNRPIVDIAPSVTGQGYYLLAGDGGVFSYGDARFFGSTGNLRLNSPALRMAATPTGNGYWFVAGDGGVFAFGDAQFFGSMGATRLNAPMIGIIPTTSGRGYWLVAEDGGVFAFGDAGFRGSLGSVPLSAPIVALAPSITNGGYWLLGRDGAIYSFGDAPFRGGEDFVTDLATDIASLPDGSGYVVLDETGGVWTHRSGAQGAQIAIPTGNPHAGATAIAIAMTLDGNGTWVAWSGRAQSDTFDTARGGFGLIAGSDWSRCRGATWRFDPREAPAGAFELYEELFDYAARVTGMAFAYGGTVGDEAIPDDTVVAGWADLSGANIGRPETGVVLGAALPAPPNRGHFWLASNFSSFLPIPGSRHDWTGAGWGQVAIHELGHVLGLDHVDDPSSVMNPASNILVRWGDGDLAGLRFTLAC
ncbi:MAG: matrixin family metalloprotease [Actinomycetota bacterium]